MRVSSVKAGGNRFERRRSRTRDRLLTAATRVLARQGLHETTIADIARAADIGVGTFYLHFSTKDDLFRALVEDTVARLKSTIDDARERAAGAVARMQAANEAFCRFADENREVFRIVFGHGVAYNDVVRRAQAMFAADLETTIREGIASGDFAALPPALVAQAIVGMATQVLSWWTEHPSPPLATLHETLTTLALRGLAPASPRKGDE